MIFWPAFELNGLEKGFLATASFLPDDGADAEEVVVNGPEALGHPVTAESPQEENDKDQSLRKWHLKTATLCR